MLLAGLPRLRPSFEAAASAAARQDEADFAETNRPHPEAAAFLGGPRKMDASTVRRQVYPIGI
ncbi:MAG: hypothetical protein ACREIP_15245, partial [Alphaproteobacteria bacterium]